MSLNLEFIQTLIKLNYFQLKMKLQEIIVSYKLNFTLMEYFFKTSTINAKMNDETELHLAAAMKMQLSATY